MPAPTRSSERSASACTTTWSRTGAFEALIRAKVRNAVEVTSERRLAVLSRDAVVRELHDLSGVAKTEPDRNRKGLLLEEVVKRLFRATPGFERVEPPEQ